MASLTSDMLEMHWKIGEKMVPGADVNALLLGEVYEVLCRHFFTLTRMEIDEHADSDGKVKGQTP